MKNGYSYVIIKHSYPELERESVLLENKYNKNKKYAFIEKIVNKDNSENISRIVYSNDMETLQNSASKYLSWYNYPLNLYKDIQQNIRLLP